MYYGLTKKTKIIVDRSIFWADLAKSILVDPLFFKNFCYNCYETGPIIMFYFGFIS